jgi:hypothetical protein
MAKRLQRGVFVDWPRYDGFISDSHPFWDREEMWVSRDISFVDDGLRNHPRADFTGSMTSETIWWREKLHFPYRNRHNSTHGPNNAKPRIPYSGNANSEYAEDYANGLPINIFDLSSPYPYDWRTACLVQFQNQGDPEMWMKSNQGKITQGVAYWSLRGISNSNQNWIAIGFFDNYDGVTFQEMGFIFEDGREYTGKKAYDLLKSQYAIPISINSHVF